MFHTVGRKLLWAYALLMLIAAVGYARYDFYQMDGDGTAFLDIAQDLRTGHAALAVNGYWNPGYPAVLAAAESLAHPSLWRELVVVRYANVAVFTLAMIACFLFTSGLDRARQRYADGSQAAIGANALHLLGQGLLVLSLGRELPIAAPRSDTLLLVFLLLAMALLLRLSVGAGLWAYPALGLALGCAYLTKSFAFLPSIALIAAMLLYAAMSTRERRIRILVGSLLTAAVFALTAGPYILAISRQLGHFTTGDSARLNYAFFIDNTARWHEWFHGTLGHATGPFLHPEALLATAPPVYSYAAHPYGTFPLWFDPAWWTAGLKPHISLSGHLLRLLRNVVVFLRYLLGRPEPLVLLAVALLFGGAIWPAFRAAPRRRLWALAPIGWGLLMLAIYFPIDLQDRYLTAPFLLVLLPLFALLRVNANPSEQGSRFAAGAAATALIVLFAGIAITQAGTYLAERRRHISPAYKSHPGLDSEIFPAAQALDRLGLRTGDTVACMGDIACDTDPYWARLAGAQTLAEVETPDQADPQMLWESIPDKAHITGPLRRMGIRFIVTTFANSVQKPEGWVQLGHSDYFAYPLQQPVSAQTARSIAEAPLTP